MRNSLSTIAAITVLLIGTRITGNAQTVIWDTIGTGTVRLAVSNHGSVGLNGIGGANMDFTSSGLDCDPSADVYLKSGGLFIIQKIDSAVGLFSWSTGLYQNDASASFSFKPDGSGPSSSHFIGPDGSDAFFTGRSLNWDSTIGIEQTNYAPTTGAPNDNFIIVRTDIYPLDGLDHPDLAIGEVIDWDIPSDSDAANLGGIFRQFVYLQGTDTGAVAGCQPNSNRFGNSLFLGMYTNAEFNNNPCASTLDLWGIYSNDNLSETSSAPNGVLDSAIVWNYTASLTAQWVLVDTAADQRIYSTYIHGQTLASTDTLTVYTAIISQQNGTVNDLDSSGRYADFWYNENLRCGGVDPSLCFATGNADGDLDGIVDIADLTFLIDHLFISFPESEEPWKLDINGDCIVDSTDVWTIINCLLNPPGNCSWNTLTCCDPEIRWPPPCCEGVTGNIDNDPEANVDISDLTFLIDHLFIDFPALVCFEEGNVDGDSLGTVDIADLTHLIDHLFINFPPTKPCR